MNLKSEIQTEDVLSVAKSLKIELTDAAVAILVKEYYPREGNDNWTQDVEDAIYEMLREAIEDEIKAKHFFLFGEAICSAYDGSGGHEDKNGVEAVILHLQEEGDGEVVTWEPEQGPAYLLEMYNGNEQFAELTEEEYNEILPYVPNI